MLSATALSEAEFQAQLLELAHLLGWRHNFTRRSIGKGRKWTTATSCIGWPDLTLWSERRHRLVLAELKSDTGRVTTEQQEVLASLRTAGVEAYLWRPGDWDEIERVLR